MAFWTILYSKTTMVHPRYHGLLDQAILKNDYGTPSFPWPFGPNYIRKRLRYTLATMAFWTKLYSKTTTVYPRFHDVLDLCSKTTTVHTRYHGLLDQAIFENDYGTPSFPWRFGPMFENDYGTHPFPWRFGPIFENYYGTSSFPRRFGPIFENDYGTHPLPWPFGPTYIRKQLRYTLVSMAFWTYIRKRLRYNLATMAFWTKLYSKMTTVHPRFHGIVDLCSKTTTVHPRYHGLFDQTMFENDYGTPSLPWPFGPNYIRKRLRYTPVTMAFWTKLYSKTTTVHTRYHGLLDQTIFENDYGTHPLPWPFGPNYIRKRLRYTPVTMAFWTKLFSKTTTVHTRYHGVLDQTKYLAISVSDNISWEKLTYK